jgi:hypothetical protein
VEEGKREAEDTPPRHAQICGRRERRMRKKERNKCAE